MAATQRHDDVVDHGHLAEQLRGLIGAGEPGLCDRARRPAEEILRSKAHHAGVGAIKPADQIEHRAFSGAVRPDDARDLARPGLEADAAHSTHAAETDRQIAYQHTAALEALCEISRDSALVLGASASPLPLDN